MNRCPITYEACEGGKYSLKGLKKLSPRLTSLNDFPFSAEDQIKEAMARAGRMSIQGVQPKLSVRLNVKRGSLRLWIQAAALFSNRKRRITGKFRKMKM